MYIAPLSLVPSQENVFCFGGTNGKATVVASGGTVPYSYLWLPSGGSAATASGLIAGNYEVTVSDARGCAKKQSFTITQPGKNKFLQYFIFN